MYLGSFSPNGLLVAFGRGTNDRITVDPSIKLPATLYGSGRGDTIVAGGGNTVMVGGAGNVTLVSGAGNNIMISGGSSSPTVSKTLIGTAGNNIMIGGSTNYDNNDQALARLLAEWGSAEPYAMRMSELMNGGGLNGNYELNGTTVHDNGVREHADRRRRHEPKLVYRPLRGRRRPRHRDRQEEHRDPNQHLSEVSTIHPGTRQQAPPLAHGAGAFSFLEATHL